MGEGRTLKIKFKRYLYRMMLMLAGAAIMPLAGYVIHQNQVVQMVQAAAIPADDAKLPTFMPNAKLRYLVWDNYNDQAGTQPIASPAEMTKGDLAKLQKLNYSPSSGSPQAYVDAGPIDGGNGGIGPNNPGNYSLEGLQYATSLQEINLSPSLDFAPKYFHGDITDISPLADLKNLTEVNLYSNRISDVTPLKNLKNIKELRLQYNCIEDLSSLSISNYKSFSYFKQQVVLPTVHLTGNTYTWQAPFKEKLPQGVAYNKYNLYGPNKANDYWWYKVDANVKPMQQVFYTGDKVTWTGSDNYVFNNLLPQVTPGPTNDPSGGSYKVLGNPYKYYMIGEYKDTQINSGYPIMTYYLPYEDNVKAIEYRIIPYDQATNEPIPNYDPVKKSDLPGTAVEVPEIAGYTPIAKTVTVPENGGDVKAWYTKNPVAQGTVTVHYEDDQNNQLKDDTSSTGDVNSPYTAPTPDATITVNGTTYNYVGVKPGESIPTTYTDQPQSFTYVYSEKAVDVDLNYTVKTIDSNGQDLGKGYTASGKSGSVIKAPAIDGYTASPAQTVLDKEGQIITFVYTKNSTGGGTGGGGIITPIIPATPLTPATPTTPAKPITPATPIPPTEPGVVAKGEVIYAVNKVYLYKNATFKKSQRVASYDKKPRINRPMFVVTDYAKSSNGRLRYKVRDVNHVTKNKYRTGYLTTNSKFVVPVYYQSKPKVVTVINPKGVNAYYNKNLTRKVKNYKQGTVLKVKGIVRHNLTTRFILTNGRHITANRKLVITGKYKAAKMVQAKGAINRYSKANLTKRNKHYNKQTKKVFKVKRWEYSQANSTKKHGVLRYQVAGGYITGNSKYVKIIK